VDRSASARLADALVANGIVVERMAFGRFTELFDDYLLLRKLYVFKLARYERALLLDIDGVVTGSLRFLFDAPLACDAPEIAAPGATGPCAVVDRGTCAPGRTADVLALQTSGTPVLTAYLLAVPSDATWAALGEDLERQCGGASICDRRRVNARGWGAFPAPHAWATRADPSRRLGWDAMGAGFSDQGFAEYFFALKRRTAKLVSKWSCPKRLHFLHFNVPPKPWTCPGASGCDGGDATAHGKAAAEWDSPAAYRSYGGHHCARDWWWQYAAARPRLKTAGCASSCAAALDAAAADRGGDDWANYTSMPRCQHLYEDPTTAGLRVSA